MAALRGESSQQPLPSPTRAGHTTTPLHLDVMQSFEWDGQGFIQSPAANSAPAVLESGMHEEYQEQEDEEEQVTTPASTRSWPGASTADRSPADFRGTEPGTVPDPRSSGEGEGPVEQATVILPPAAAEAPAHDALQSQTAVPDSPVPLSYQPGPVMGFASGGSAQYVPQLIMSSDTATPPATPIATPAWPSIQASPGPRSNPPLYSHSPHNPPQPSMEAWAVAPVGTHSPAIPTMVQAVSPPAASSTSSFSGGTTREKGGLLELLWRPKPPGMIPALFGNSQLTTLLHPSPELIARCFSGVGVPGLLVEYSSAEGAIGITKDGGVWVSTAHITQIPAHEGIQLLAAREASRIEARIDAANPADMAERTELVLQECAELARRCMAAQSQDMRDASQILSKACTIVQTANNARYLATLGTASAGGQPLSPTDYGLNGYQGFAHMSG
eukprot:TRINITY_DN3788_c1_g1_i2.p1 TRINITY_DN3788_c1_g1~~TRINITY_DN3788_c1_g1_i2.p1  ORF type:complete len:445 (+),score=67.86 TRINITY_DN3788_c1_g1_i2:163-1497(+)